MLRISEWIILENKIPTQLRKKGKHPALISAHLFHLLSRYPGLHETLQTCFKLLPYAFLLLCTFNWDVFLPTMPLSNHLHLLILYAGMWKHLAFCGRVFP